MSGKPTGGTSDAPGQALTPTERQARIDAWKTYRDSLPAKDRAGVGLVLAELMKANPKDTDVVSALASWHGVSAERVLRRSIGGGGAVR